MTTTPSELVALRKLCHEVSTQGPKNWRAGLLNELASALAAALGTTGEVVATVIRGSKRAHIVWRDEAAMKHGQKLYAAPQPASDGWLAIESAPKDGETPMLFWEKSAFIGYRGADFPDDAACDSLGTACYPTHWQSLPPPPAAGGAGG